MSSKKEGATPRELTVKTVKRLSSYRIETTIDGTGWKQEILPLNPHIPLRIEFRSSDNDQIEEIVEIGEIAFTAKFAPLPNDRKKLTPVAISMRNEKGNYDNIDLSNMPRDKEIIAADGTLALFVNHPNLSPDTTWLKEDPTGQFSPRKETDESWVVYHNEHRIGFTLPLAIDRSKIPLGMTPLDLQLFAIPNEEGTLIPPQLVGKSITRVPFAIGTIIESQKKHNPDTPMFTILTGQRLGHTNIIMAMLYVAFHDRKWGRNEIKVFLPPTEQALRLNKHFQERYGMDPNLIAGFQYLPEPGYTNGELFMDFNNPKAMLAFLALNFELTKTILKHLANGVVVYDDTKQDMLFYNFLTFLLGGRIRICSKTYSCYENIPPYLEGISKIMERIRQSISFASPIFNALDRSGPPDFFSFMADKILAAANLTGSPEKPDSLALYSTTATIAEAPKVYENTPIVPIPLAFPSAYDSEMGSPDSKYRTPKGARERLVEKIQDPTVKPSNIPEDVYQKLRTDSNYPVILFQLGNSESFHIDKLIATILEVAKNPSMRDKLFVLTGYRPREAYLSKIAEITRNENHPKGLTEQDQEFPRNVVVLGMRRDALKIMHAADVVITTTSMGNLTDCITARKPSIFLAPDIPGEEDLKKMWEKMTESTPQELLNLLDKLAVMLETAPERALNLAQIAARYQKNGLDPNQTIFDITQHEKNATQELLNRINFALTHSALMADTIGAIPTLSAENLLEIVNLLRNGAHIETITQYIERITPNFRVEELNS